jgi:uncharacterized membrane protein YgcG
MPAMARNGRAALARRRGAARLAVVGLAVAGVLSLVAAPTMALDLPPSQAGVSVYDLAHVWSPGTIASATASVDAIRGRTHAEIAIVSWPTGLSGVSTDLARTDAATIMDTWGVGRAGSNDGLVILFDLDDTLRHGQIYLFTGSGFRDLYLSDAEAHDIVDGTMLPRAKDGDLDAALLDGLARVDHVMQPGGNPDRTGQAILQALVSAAILGGTIGLVGLFLWTWRIRGRDARIPTIDDSVLLPAPPPGLTPALATVLRKDEVDDESFTAALVDLGHRGLVTFAEDDGDKHHVNLVIPEQPGTDAAAEDARRRPLGPAETRLLDEIRQRVGNADVGGSAGDAVLGWQELRRGAGKELLKAFRSVLGRAALASGWFRDDPTALTGRWTSIGGALAIGALVAGAIFVFDSGDNSNLVQAGRGYLVMPLALAGGTGVAVALLSRFLAARTADGAQTLAMALAYRNTLRFEIAQSQTIGQAVERTTSRLPWITTPDELTVWAVALGLKHDVDRLIKDTFKADPQGGWSPLWYAGSGGFGSVGDVTSMLSSISTTAASSSGSGYGGGSSGGGGGAGGGF